MQIRMARRTRPYWTKTPFYITEEKLAFSRGLRNNPTKAESLLWDRIKGRQLKGYTFTRQKVILGWIVDFYCPARRLVIELDGTDHDPNKDAIRDRAMNKVGIYVLRFPNSAVFSNIDSVVERISSLLPTR